MLTCVALSDILDGEFFLLGSLTYNITMKILCIADIHGDVGGVRSAADYAGKNGIKDVLVLGDFPGHGMFHDVSASMLEIRRSLDQLRGLNVLAIPGNCDPRFSLDFFEECGVGLHGRVKEIDGVRFAGFGGSNITPFGTPFELSEEEIYSGLAKLLSDSPAERTVVVVHCPPRNTKCDITGNGMHAGSDAVRKALEEFQPALAVCSHIHESGGSSDVIGSTVVANVGRLSEGRIGVLDLGRNVGISLERI